MNASFSHQLECILSDVKNLREKNLADSYYNTHKFLVRANSCEFLVQVSSASVRGLTVVSSAVTCSWSLVSKIRQLTWSIHGNAGSSLHRAMWPNNHRTSVTPWLLWFDMWLHVEALWLHRDSVPLVCQFTTKRTSLSCSPPPAPRPTYCDCALQQILINVRRIIHAFTTLLTWTVSSTLKVLTKSQKFWTKGLSPQVANWNCHLTSKSFEFSTISF